MAKVFISYRRRDARYPALRLSQCLGDYVERPAEDIFIDVDSIPVGEDFVDYLNDRVAQCDLLLALIGDNWLEARDPATGVRRLDDPDDFVRIEIAAALQRNIPVVPVLLDGVAVPKADQLPEVIRPLVRRHGFAVRAETFEADIARLVARLPVELPGKETARLRAGIATAAPPTPPQVTAAAPAPEPKRAGWVIPMIAALLVAGVVGAVLVADPFGWRGAPDFDLADGPPPPVEGVEEGAADPAPPALEEAVDDEPPAPVIEAAAAPPLVMGSAAERSAVLRALQEALRTLGHYSGTADGQAGPGTRSGAAAFAVAEGLDLPDFTGAPLSTLEAFQGRASLAAARKVEADRVAREAAERQRRETAQREAEERQRRDAAQRAERERLAREAEARQRREETERQEAELRWQELSATWRAGNIAFHHQKDYVRAREHFQVACDGGYPTACSDLGALYDMGYGVPIDKVGARRLFQRACDGASPTGCSNLGNLHYLGLGGPVNQAEGARLLRKGCAEGDQWGCDKLAEYGLARQ